MAQHPHVEDTPVRRLLKDISASSLKSWKEGLSTDIAPTVVYLQSPKASSRPASPVEERPSSSRVSSKKRVSLPEDADKPQAPVLPLLVDSRNMRNTPLEAGLAYMAAIEPLAPKLEKEGLFGRETPTIPWPQILKSGGPNCSGPRGTGLKNSARKKPVCEPLGLGEVLLLGAGLRPQLPGTEVSQQQNEQEVPETSPSPKGLETKSDSTNTDVKGQSVGKADVDGQSNKDATVPSTSEDASQPVATIPAASSTGENAPEPAVSTSAEPREEASQPTESVPAEPFVGVDASQPTAPALLVAELTNSNNADASLPLESTLPFESTFRASPQPSSPPEVTSTLEQELLTPKVSTQEVALQTDAPLAETCLSSRGLSSVKFDAPAEDKRVLILQRCDRRQIDFAKWSPIAEPETSLSREMRYLSHVRNRFPGTIEGGTFGANDRRSGTPHIMNLLRRRENHGF